MKINAGEKKLFVTDMDGTLLDSEKKLPANFQETVRELEAAGHVLAFASGRSYQGLCSLYGSYSGNFAYISDNGCMAVYHGKVLMKDALNKEELNEVEALLNLDSHLVITFCGMLGNYLLTREEMDENQLRELTYYYECYERISSVDEIQDAIIKAALLYNGDIGKNILPRIHLSENLAYPVTAFNWIDVFHHTCSKGKAIEVLRKYLNIPKENVYAFGDYFNDLSMAEYAGTTFAMSNAVPEVKRAFTDEIGSNEEGAVTDTILKLI